MINTELFGDELVLTITAEQPLTLSMILLYAICVYAILLGTTFSFTYVLGCSQLLDNKRPITTLFQTLLITFMLGLRLDIYSYNPTANINYEIVVMVLIIPSMAYTVLRGYKRVSAKETVVLVVSQLVSIIAALAFTRSIDYNILSNKILGENQLILNILIGLIVSFIIANVFNNLEYYDTISLMITNISNSIISIVLIIAWQFCMEYIKLPSSNIVNTMGLSIILLICFSFTISEYRDIIKNKNILATIALYIPHILYISSIVLGIAGGN